ncbi:MAG TPA: hypothetical protein VKA54_22095 [Gemmatimonadaceae bacterium]|nr:hypothetical protein [Gemmatimonadaceae bacterium]
MLFPPVAAPPAPVPLALVLVPAPDVDPDVVPALDPMVVEDE